MAPTKLALALDWLPNAASHAGFYVAQAQGLYEKHGLDVTIISPHSGARCCSSHWRLFRRRILRVQACNMCAWIVCAFRVIQLSLRLWEWKQSRLQCQLPHPPQTTTRRHLPPAWRAARHCLQLHPLVRVCPIKPLRRGLIGPAPSAQGLFLFSAWAS